MNKELENNKKFIDQKIGKKTGFSVSVNYFETIENNFSARLYEETNTNKVSFETPSNYFESLEDRILQKVVLEKKPVKIISLKQRVLKMIPLAAAAVVILFIGLQFLTPKESAFPTFNSISDNEIENWLEKNSDNINSEDITLIFTEVDLLESDFAFTDINDTNIENYIYRNDDLTIIDESY